VNSPSTSSTQFQWTVSLRASCLHAAEALAYGRLVVDPRLAEAVSEPAHELRAAISAEGLPRTPFWRNLVGLCVVVDGWSELAERAVVRTSGAERAPAAAHRVAAALAALEASVRRALPNLADELALRLPPLRDHWEIQGPRLLEHMVRWTDPRVAVPEARIVLVHPALGGGGAAHIAFNNVHLEAVLTNPVPELPENLRLAWLLGQLSLDLPVFCDHISGLRLPDVAALAMLPVALQAAAEAELVSLSPDTIDLALNAWQILTPTDIDPVDVLWRWWSTYVETRPRWDIALTALDRMLG
jgi:hypothetical protein